jgi:hypothetical protein
MMVDHLFLLAVAAIGWGLALANYRVLAHYHGWPLGEAQAIAPVTVTLIGLLSIAPGLAYAMARGPLEGGGVIVLFGAALALFWCGFLRVGAQSALLLAPLAALALIIAWPLRAAGF